MTELSVRKPSDSGRTASVRGRLDEDRVRVARRATELDAVRGERPVEGVPERT